jgi:3-dehydroquinate synthase
LLRGTLTARDEARILALVRAMGTMPPVADLRASDALDVIARDKKVIAGRLHFVLASGIGKTDIVGDVRSRELTHVMRSLGMRD